MKRCLGCGGFFEEDECPYDHSHIAQYQPPELVPLRPYIELRGRVAFYAWPDSDALVMGVLTDTRDADGTVGFCPLMPTVRVPVQDLKEIPNGEPAP